MPTSKQRELDLKDFPPGTVTEFTTLVCLACIFDIFTKQLGLAPRTAFSEIKRHTPTTDELTTRNAMRHTSTAKKNIRTVPIAARRNVGMRASTLTASKAARRLMRRGGL